MRPGPIGFASCGAGGPRVARGEATSLFSRLGIARDWCPRAKLGCRSWARLVTPVAGRACPPPVRDSSHRLQAALDLRLSEANSASQSTCRSIVGPRQARAIERREGVMRKRGRRILGIQLIVVRLEIPDPVLVQPG